MERPHDGIRSSPMRMATLGVAPRVCRPRKPQTKGKVERTVEIIKYGFWPGVHFTDLDDLNEQAAAWCSRLNQKVHHTTRRVPLDRLSSRRICPHCPKTPPGNA